MKLIFPVTDDLVERKDVARFVRFCVETAALSCEPPFEVEIRWYKKGFEMLKEHALELGWGDKIQKSGDKFMGVTHIIQFQSETL